MQMRALTLYQPWCTLMARGIKRVENRPWAPPKWLIGQRFALHAGLKWDRDAAEAIRDKFGEWIGPDDAPRGAVIATAVLERVVGSFRHLPEDQHQWFFGPIGWVLTGIRQVEPIPCRGFQRLWTLPADIAEQLAAAKGGSPCPA